MLPSRNRQIILKSRPVGIPQAHHFEIINTKIPDLKEGEFLVRNRFLSVEPAMRGWVNAVENYSDLVSIGSVMRAFTAGEVIASRNPNYSDGDFVVGMLGWQEYSVTDGRAIRRKVTETDLPLSLFLGVLGLNGFTAYLGLIEFGVPQAGDTVVVSSAGGAVGSAAGQIAKLSGCRTVGITGGIQKVKTCLNEFGFDAAVDYKDPHFEDALSEACSGGVNVYFDNTSGAISDAVLRLIARGARIVICGTASVASWDPIPTGPRVERHLLVKRARMQGFVNLDYEHRYEDVIRRLVVWVRSGQLRYREDIREGLEQAPDSIADLYRGENSGKRLIKLT